MAKIDDLLEDEGMTEEQFIENYMLDSIVPGICMNEGCSATYLYEPDSRKGHCQECNTKTVESGLSLLGLA